MLLAARREGIGVGNIEARKAPDILVHVGADL
jgi:hypothetical protein